MDEHETRSHTVAERMESLLEKIFKINVMK